MLDYEALTRGFDWDKWREPMSGKDPDPKYERIWPCYGSIKYDGIRLAMKGRQERTRGMLDIPNLSIQRTLRSEPWFAGLDFELIMGDPADPLCYNKTFSAAMSIEGEPEISFYVFDIIIPGMLFWERQELLKQHMADVPEHLKHRVFLVEQVRLDSPEAHKLMYERVTAAGHEGMITRTANSPYVFGKATAKQQYMLKDKPHYDSEFYILSCYEAMENTNEAEVDGAGHTKRSTMAEGLVPKGMLGGFNAKEVHTGVEFRCAPGKLTHKEREQLWQLWLPYVRVETSVSRGKDAAIAD